MGEFLAPGPTPETSGIIAREVVRHAYEGHHAGLPHCPSEQEVEAHAQEVLERNKAFDRLPGIIKFFKLVRELPEAFRTPLPSDRDRFGA